MKLYGSYTSPFVRHCRIALLETQLKCDFIETDTLASAQLSPTQRVPFLQDEDVFLTDSCSIIKYLREKSGQTFCTNVKELDNFCLVSTAMDATVNLFFIARDGVDTTQIPYLQRQAARIQSTLAELNQLEFSPLALPQDRLFNDAQLRLACFMGWAKFRQQLDFSEFENLEKLYQNALGYNHFIATQPPQA